MTAPSPYTTNILLTEILETVLATQERVAALERRLETIDTGLTAVTDIVPGLEIILAQILEQRTDTQAHFAEQSAGVASQVAQTAGLAAIANAIHTEILEFRAEANTDAAKIAQSVAYAHAAASGNPVALPEELLADRLLARFLARHPDSLPTVDDKAVERYRRKLENAQNGELLPLLLAQYTVSPLDTNRTLTLRFQLAAVTRTELEKRGIRAPTAPSDITLPSGTKEANSVEFERLAQTFSARPLHEVYADPLLVATVDEHDRNMASKEPLPDLKALLTRQLRDGNSLQVAHGSAVMDPTLEPATAMPPSKQSEPSGPAENQRLADLFRGGDVATIAAQPELSGAAAMMGLATNYFASAAAKSGDRSDIVQPTSDLRNLLADEIARGGRPQMKPEFRLEYLERGRAEAVRDRAIGRRSPDHDQER